MLINAKTELLTKMSQFNLKINDIQCGEIIFFKDKKIIKVLIKENFLEEEINTELEKLNHDYQNNFGSNNIIQGIIWFKNKSWLERKEYDGSSWWEVETYPKIPKYLKE